MAERLRWARERFNAQTVVMMQNAFAGPADGEEDVDFEDFAAPQLQEWAAARDNANSDNDDDDDDDEAATEEAADGQEEARGITAAEEIVQGREETPTPRPRFPSGWATIRFGSNRPPSDEESQDGDDEEDEGCASQ